MSALDWKELDRPGFKFSVFLLMCKLSEDPEDGSIMMFFLNFKENLVGKSENIKIVPIFVFFFLKMMQDLEVQGTKK